ncbi:24348_t:CDS:2 [Cetraspora pellucida]|uniref:24348_t:CDS:1 n=1 Tax=Cetraspora pellucida TaxID=1433469 RepID=A0A9N8WA01_9GLOM|nr:24348_t:CDS:2 [Cetraspora pellucida]
MLYCVFAIDEVKPSKKYQSDKDAPAWPFCIVMTEASNLGKHNVKCNDVFFFKHHLNEPKYKIVQDFYKYLAQDKSKSYYEDVTFSSLSSDKIPDLKKFNAKRSRYENIFSIYVAQKFHKILIDIYENATHIVLFNGRGSIRKLADIISPYTDVDL